MVLGAQNNRDRWESLLRLYWAPIYGFIRREGYNGHDASDLAQEFMSRVVIGRGLFAKADPERGRFRSYLKQSLRNFLVDQHRKTTRTTPARSQTLPAIATDQPTLETAPKRTTFTLNHDPASLADPLTEFDREWAAAVVDQTLRRLEDSCQRDGFSPHWKAFELNVLGPSMRKTTPIPLSDLAPIIGAIDEIQASNMLQTMKRRFRRTLREVIRETVTDDALVEQELADLRTYFAS